MNQALLVIDMQMFIQNRIDAGQRNFPKNAIKNIMNVLEKFRKDNKLIIHVIHQSAFASSNLHKDSESYPMIDATKNLPNEPTFIKNTSSAFTSTNLEHYLKEINVDEIFVVGGITGFCVNSTVRHGADLGFKMNVVDDAIIGFDLPEEGIDCKTIHNITIGLLKSDFAQIINSKQISFKY